MMKNTVTMGKNRTGVDLSPVHKQELAEVTALTVPSMEGDETVMAEARAEYFEDPETIGSMPPPGTVKGAASAALDMAKGASATVFLDKLGARLSFERSGTRLYEALIGKFDASEPLPGGPTREDLVHIHNEELQHFELCRQAMKSLGADPTAMTPSADVEAVASMGLFQVVSDPRMNLKQSLEAILVAELTDNDCWSTLIDLAKAAGHTQLAGQFEQALANEQDHLLKVRTWVKNATLAEGAPVATAVKKAIGKA